MENTKMEKLGLRYEIVKDWMSDYKDESIFYPIEKYVRNFPEELSGSQVRIKLNDNIDEIVEIK